MAFGYAHTVLANLLVVTIASTFTRNWYPETFDVLVAGEAGWTRAGFIAVENTTFGI